MTQDQDVIYYSKHRAISLSYEYFQKEIDTITLSKANYMNNFATKNY